MIQQTSRYIQTFSPSSKHAQFPQCNLILSFHWSLPSCHVYFLHTPSCNAVFLLTFLVSKFKPRGPWCHHSGYYLRLDQTSSKITEYIIHVSKELHLYWVILHLTIYIQYQLCRKYCALMQETKVIILVFLKR